MKKFFLSFIRKKSCKNLPGVTLVELLLYIGLSFFVIASIFTAFVISNRRFIEQRSSSRTVDDVREAVNILAREIRMAGHKFYLFRNSAGQTVEGIIQSASYPDGSSFLFVDNADANGLSDRFTFRHVPIAPNGMLVDQNNSPTQNPGNAIIHEVTYRVNNSRLERTLQRLNSTGANIGSPITSVITDDVVGFQVEFGLVGINREISPASATATGVWASPTGVTVAPIAGENAIQVSGNATSFNLTFRGQGGTRFPIRRGSKYSLFFDMREVSSDLRFNNCIVLIRAGTTEFELSNINYIGRQYADNPMRLIFESPIDHNGAEIVFRFTMSGANYNIDISTLRFREDRRGEVTWVGSTQGRAIWNDASGRTGSDSINYRAYFPSGTTPEWDANRQHVRLARVSVLTRTARAQTRAEPMIFEFGNVRYDTEAQNTSNFQHRIHRTVVSMEDNGVFPRADDGAMFHGEQIQRPPGAGTPGTAPGSPPASAPASPPASAPASAVSSAPTSAPPASVAPPQTFNVNFITVGNGSTNPLLFNGVNSGTNVTVQANPTTPGNIFVRWEGSPINNSTTNPITFGVFDNYTITAVFAPSRTITNNIPALLGILEVNGVSLASGSSVIVIQGSQNSLRFIPVANYTWNRWTTPALSTVATNNPVTNFEVNADIPVSAIIQGLQGLYRFENNPNDSSIFARAGSASNIAYRNSCVGTRAAFFNGTNSHVDIGNYNLEGDQLTISAWVKQVSRIGNDQHIVSKSNANTLAGTDWTLTITNTGAIRFGLRREGQTNSVNYTTATTPLSTLHRWHHIAAVYDGANVRIHVDGTQAFSTAVTGNIASSGNRIWIGGQPGSPTGNPFSGVIDDVRIFNRGLTATEITTLRNANSGTCVNRTLTVSATNGSVTVNGTPYTAPLSFGVFSQVALQAIANTGHTFSSWSGGLTGTANPATVTMDVDRNITANFALAGATTNCNQNLTVFTETQAVSWRNHEFTWSASHGNVNWHSGQPGFSGNAHNQNFNAPNTHEWRNNEINLASTHNFRNGTLSFGFSGGSSTSTLNRVEIYLRDASNNRSVSVIVPNHLEPREAYSFATTSFTPLDAGFNIEAVNRIGFSFRNMPNNSWTEFWWDNIIFTCASAAPPPPPPPPPTFTCNTANSTRFAHDVVQQFQIQPGSCAVYNKTTPLATPLRVGSWGGISFTAEFMDSQGNRVTADINSGDWRVVSGLAPGDVFMHIISSSGTGQREIRFNSW